MHNLRRFMSNALILSVPHTANCSDLSEVGFMGDDVLRLLFTESQQAACNYGESQCRSGDWVYIRDSL